MYNFIECVPQSIDGRIEVIYYRFDSFLWDTFQNESLGVEHQKFEVDCSGRYNGAFRTKADASAIPADELVASNIIVALSTKSGITKI